MGIGFRKSLFGFNCEDVINYIEKTHHAFVDKESALNCKVEELNNELNLSKEECEKLNAEKERVSAELNEFNEKYDEIRRLSDNIGKLYLVAQANARAIMDNATRSSELAADEVERNVGSIDSAHESLDSLKEKILKTSDEFAGKVDELMNSLAETKRQIQDMSIESCKHSNEFEELYNSIVK